MNNVSRQAARRNARSKALQALYQWDLSHAEPDTNELDTVVAQVLDQFSDSQDMSKVDEEYFSELFSTTVQKLGELDAVLESSLDRNIADIDPIERCACRLGAYELTERLDIPLLVVINEWVEITKKFGSEQGYKYVNGVLDKCGQQTRTIEAGSLQRDTPSS